MDNIALITHIYSYYALNNIVNRVYGYGDILYIIEIYIVYNIHNILQNQYEKRRL